MAVKHSDLTGEELHQPFRIGLDADKPATPVVGDWYFATDTKKLYTCLTAGVWTEYLPTQAVMLTGDQSASGHKTFSSGITATPIERVAVRMSANQTTTSGVEVTVNFDTVVIDTANGFNTTTHEYTIQNSGLFLIIARVLFLYGDGDNVRVRLYQNGGIIASSHGTWQACVAHWAMLNAGDVLFITGTQYSGASMDIDSTSYNTRWDIIRIL